MLSRTPPPSRARLIGRARLHLAAVIAAGAVATAGLTVAAAHADSQPNDHAHRDRPTVTPSRHQRAAHNTPRKTVPRKAASHRTTSAVRPAQTKKATATPSATPTPTPTPVARTHAS